ncbi:uncharacterized protein LY79DRAFT_248315 [Colletotrichum navitas]|uniref:2EXR domain-containing protein n=1 Tax=Colletotrichum navitas TaxID=681940 RepID=A0AAD8QC42_9PEZI|nr:uncharacterized protein LY79DRAFT_248315 [Colletotrichum navitas]KAK1598573.1 hypothetical protein LY79DRAFT_248315 [Colletotrichum navitas]
MVLHNYFHLFDSLPAEIRRAIWIEALSQPRVIKIIGPHRDPINRVVQMGVDTGPTIPSTAMACSEAYGTLKEAFPCLAVPHHNSPPPRVGVPQRLHPLPGRLRHRTSRQLHLVTGPGLHSTYRPHHPGRHQPPRQVMAVHFPSNGPDVQNLPQSLKDTPRP